MKIAIMQPYFFPYLGYWQLVRAVDIFVVLDDVNFIKRGWIHRNIIANQCQCFQINLMVRKASQNRMINEHELSSDHDWSNLLRKQIENAYSKADYRNEGLNLIEDVLGCPETNLARYLTHSIRKISNYLNIDTQIVVNSDINDVSVLKGEDRIIEICESLNATSYINAIGGQKIYSSESFMAKDISLKFIKMKEDLTYSQACDQFIPNLSIIDIIMNNSTKEISRLLNNYELITA